MVLDIGNPEIASIPLGTRFSAGLLQAIDVRASGFSVVPIAALAPAVKYVRSTSIIAFAHCLFRIMYVIMMYISVCACTLLVKEFAADLPFRPDSNEVSCIKYSRWWQICGDAFSVRSTNVYEEQSLGIFHVDDQLSAAEQVFKGNGSRMAMWGRYFAMHARHQLSFGVLPLYLRVVFI